MKPQLDARDILIANRIQDGMTRRKGKRWAITSKKMVQVLRAEGFKGVNDVKIREIVHSLRTTRQVFICADEKGYYIAETEEEKKHQIASLASRIREIQEVKDTLVRIMNKDTEQAELFQN